MDFKSQYGTFKDHYSNQRTAACCGLACVGCMMAIVIAISLTFTVGIDIAIIMIGSAHSNTTCDANYHAYPLSQWLIIFGSVDIAMFGLTMFIIACIFCASSSDKLMVPVGISMILSLIWFVFLLTMTIMGIIELVHVFQKCIVEEYVLAVTVLVIVILKLVQMCCTTQGFRSNRSL